MKKILIKAALPALIITGLLSCNQEQKTSTPAKVSEFKDSTSFAQGVKVFVKPTARIKVIDSVKTTNDTTYYFVEGEKYQAKDLKSLD